ncbi:MAG: metal-dependent hydrolase [Gorillibacterium sp.]|nr:metal-dependent hydrolase [Gorillibacterium sp.]
MDIIYHGHACVQLVHEGHSVMIDPFLTGNSLATVRAEELEAEYILLTHGHGDHIGDTEAIAKRTGATVISIVELASYMERTTGVKTVGMNLGGTVEVPFARFKMVQAFHSSSITTEDGQIIYMGMPAGFVIEMGGKTVYHSGDTALFGDMKLIGDRHSIDVAFVPIGDHFTMGPEDAVWAAEWLKAKLTVPMHYNTFPPIRQDADSYIAMLAKRDIHGRVLKSGEALTL